MKKSRLTSLIILVAAVSFGLYYLVQSAGLLASLMQGKF